MIHIDLMFISMISVVAPMVLGATLYKILPRELRVLVIYIFVKGILEGVVYVLWQLSLNNLAFFHLFTLLEFGFISLIYYLLFIRIRRVRYGILSLGTIFLILSMYLLFYQEQLDSFNSLQRGLEHIIVLLYVSLFFILFFKQLPRERYLLKPYFILTGSFLFYFAFSFLVLLDAQEYVNFENLFNWSVNSVINMVLNAALFATLWTGGRMMRTSD